ATTYSILLLLSTVQLHSFINCTATPEIYTLSLHDALPILQITRRRFLNEWEAFKKVISRRNIRRRITIPLTLSNLKLLRRITRTENILHRNLRLLRVSGIVMRLRRSEERFSRNAETDLVCRLLLEKKKKN